MDGRRRGGGDAPRAATTGRSPRASDDVLAALPARLLERTARRDARLGARARDRAARRRRRRRVAELARAARRARATARAARHARRGRRHAPVRAVAGRRGLARRALPVPLRLDARAGPARADVRAARARRGARPRDGACARSTRMRAHLPLLLALSAQLAVLAGPRHRAWPRRARRSSRPSRASGIPRAFALLRRLRRGGRRAAALRRDPRADVPVVGRAAAAALRHARGAGHGRADARRPTPPRSSRSCSALVRLEALEGCAEPRALVAARRCSTRTASSPRATAWRRSCIDPDHGAARPARELLERAARRRARRTPPSLGCAPELESVRGLAAAAGAARQRSRAGRGAAPQLGRVMRALARGLHVGARRSTPSSRSDVRLRRRAAPRRARRIATRCARMSDALAPRGPDGARRCGSTATASGSRTGGWRSSTSPSAARSRWSTTRSGSPSSSTAASTTTASCARELEAARPRASARPPTPRCCCKGWAEWGEGVLDRLEGMFAFALVEQRTRARGARARPARRSSRCTSPSCRRRRCAFASTLPALLAAGGVDTSVDPVALHHYLSLALDRAGAADDPARRAQAAAGDGAGDRARRAPRASGATGTRRSSATHARLVRRRTGRTRCARRCASRCGGGWSPTCRWGSCSRAGWTRSLIVALLAEQGQRGLATFSIGFRDVGDREGDEFEFSDLVAREFGTDHHQIRVGAGAAASPRCRRRSRR